MMVSERSLEVTGRVQFQVWYTGERYELTVGLMCATGLVEREHSLGIGDDPEAFARIRLLPKT